MTQTDYFSKQAADYSTSRPTYPTALFRCLAGYCDRHDRALDCAAGNGQASRSLLEHFDEVVACDLSFKQVQQSVPEPNLHYLCASATQLPFKAASFDLICVAQAWHWFASPEFETEAMRLLVPNGILAIWGYNLLSIDAAVDTIIHHYYLKIAGPYWPPQRRILEHGYQDFPFLLLPLPDADPAGQFSMQANWNRSRLEQYLRSWSATQRLLEAGGKEDFEATLSALQKVWPDKDQVRKIYWPLTLKIGKITA